MIYEPLTGAENAVSNCVQVVELLGDPVKIKVPKAVGLVETPIGIVLVKPDI